MLCFSANRYKPLIILIILLKACTSFSCYPIFHSWLIFPICGNIFFSSNFESYKHLLTSSICLQCLTYFWKGIKLILLISYSSTDLHHSLRCCPFIYLQKFTFKSVCNQFRLITREFWQIDFELWFIEELLLCDFSVLNFIADFFEILFF